MADINQLAGQFVNYYYETFDKDRSLLKNLYVSSHIFIYFIYLLYFNIIIIENNNTFFHHIFILKQFIRKY